MNKPLLDYKGRCGNCKNFMFFSDGKKVYMRGVCLLKNRRSYHQSSQFACKLYVDSN